MIKCTILEVYLHITLYVVYILNVNNLIIEVIMSKRRQGPINKRLILFLIS